MPSIRYEQAVYGSFPFWDRGYGMLAHSSGCRAEWLRAFQAACQKYGQAVDGIRVEGAMFTIRLPGGPWAVVGVSPQGRDDHGRAGALSFHGLFVAGRDLGRAPAGPFSLVALHRAEWPPGLDRLEAGVWSVAAEPGSEPRPLDPRAEPIARALAAGKRVAIEAREPINDLARQVWIAGGAPFRHRRRSVATLAFSTANQYDLVALPRLGPRESTAGYLRLEDLPSTQAQRDRGGRFRAWWIAGTIAAAAGAGLWLLSRARESRPGASNAVTPVGGGPGASEPFGLDSEERARVLEGLLDLAMQCGVTIDAEVESDPTALMLRIGSQVRYHGPWLSGAEVETLGAEGGSEAGQALRWHEHLLHFAPERSLSATFPALELPRQLEDLERSFDVVLDPAIPAQERPAALAEALAARGPVRNIPLSERHPALADYAKFLSRLPRSRAR